MTLIYSEQDSIPKTTRIYVLIESQSTKIVCYFYYLDELVATP